MSVRFKFNGGVAKPTFHQMEKFLLFFVVGGREVPLYQMLKNNLVVKLHEKDIEYQTSNNIVKIFVMQSGYGIPKRYYSFYFRLVPPPSPRITIKSFSEKSDFFFSGMGRFLKRQQILDLLTDESGSKRFVARQLPLPLDTLRNLVSVDRTEMRKGIRVIRLGGKKK